MKKLLFLFLLAVALQAHAAEDWVLLSSGVTKEWSDISCPEPRTCYLVSGLYLVGGTGSVLKTTDGGETFAAQALPTSNPLHAISCPVAEVCYAVGDFGTFLKTADGGETWSETTLGNRADTPQLNGVFAQSAERVVVVGRDGFLRRTKDGGAHFFPPAARTLADLYSVYFSNASTGFIGGNNGAFLVSQDGGESWSPRGALRDAGALRSIGGDGEETLYAVGDAVHTSADGGASFVRRNTAGLDSGYRSVAVRSASRAYLVAATGSVFKTEDGGVSWSPAFSREGVLLRDIVCPGGAYCLAVGGSGRIFRLGTPPPPPPPPPPVPEPVAPAASSTQTAGEASIPLTPPTPPAPPAPERLSSQTTSLEANLNGKASETRTGESAPAAPVETPQPVVVSPVARAPAFVFTRTLRRGASGDEVKRMQEILAAVGTLAADSVTGYFGRITASALGAFQEKYGIAKEGELGYGQAGPKTRAKLMELFKRDLADGASPPPARTSKTTPLRQESETPFIKGDTTPLLTKVAETPAVFARTLKKGSRGDDVKKLQEFLSADAEVYPEGEVTGYFGPMTAKAVGRFQERHGVAAPGEPGFGQLGPKTRAKLLEVSE